MPDLVYLCHVSAPCVTVGVCVSVLLYLCVCVCVCVCVCELLGALSDSLNVP